MRTWLLVISISDSKQNRDKTATQTAETSFSFCYYCHVVSCRWMK